MTLLTKKVKTCSVNIKKVHQIYFCFLLHQKWAGPKCSWALVSWCDVRAREQKVVFPASAEEWFLIGALIREGSGLRDPQLPATPSSREQPGCCSCLSWLTTSPFDPSHGSWQAPRRSRRKHKYKVHTLTKACGHTQHRVPVCGSAHTVMQLGFNEWFSEEEAGQQLCLNQKKRATLLAIASGTGANTWACSFTFIILRWPLKLNIDDLKCTCCWAFVGKWNKHRTAYSTCSLILSLVSTISAYCYLISGSSNKSDSFAPLRSACISGAKEHEAACQSGCQRALWNNRGIQDGTRKR